MSQEGVNQAQACDVILEDAVPDLDGVGQAALDIKVRVEMKGEAPFYGIAICWPEKDIDPERYEHRVLVENKHGKLMCHIWATEESVLDGEPSHSIEIAPCRKGGQVDGAEL